jgi:uncharacterized protein YjhX (UPF0386 family)
VNLASELAKGKTEVAVFLRFLDASHLPIDRNSVEKRSPPEPDILCTHQSEGGSRIRARRNARCAIRRLNCHGSDGYLRTSDPSANIISKMESGRVMARKGIGLQYRLISLWPINKRNVASSEFEKIGLGTILTHPTKPYTGFVKEGGARYFQAVYPDLAVAQACIGCHNSHPGSPKRDFKINDVMGGLVISIPLK